MNSESWAYFLLAIAILCITVLECTAMIVLKIDSALLSSIVAVIASLATYSVQRVRYQKRRR